MFVQPALFVVFDYPRIYGSSSCTAVHTQRPGETKNADRRADDRETRGGEEEIEETITGEQRTYMGLRFSFRFGEGRR